MKIRPLLLLAAFGLNGCTAVDYAAALVDSYCNLPEEERMVNRMYINSAVSPNKITVECAL